MSSAGSRRTRDDICREIRELESQEMWITLELENNPKNQNENIETVLLKPENRDVKQRIMRIRNRISSLQTKLVFHNDF